MMKHITAKLTMLAFTMLIMLASCEYEYYVIPAPKPTVTSTDPADAATGVALTKKITASFDMAMDPSTINGTTFFVKHGDTLTNGTVSYSGTTASFIPSVNFYPNATYTATITSVAKSKGGIPMAGNFVWSFTTGSDTTGNDTTVVVTDTISFSEDIIPIFAANCVSCHKGSIPPDLRASNAYNSLISGNFVISKDPDNSILYKELKPGGGMAGYSNANNLKLIKRWIEAGIKNN